MKPAKGLKSGAQSLIHKPVFMARLRGVGRLPNRVLGGQSWRGFVAHPTDFVNG